MKKLIYRLKNERTPESWELPLRNIILPRKNPNTGFSEDRLIHYLPGAPSIWAEDYKGDKKPIPAVTFEHGILEVNETDVLLIEILSKHRFNNVHYELYDNDALAQNKLGDFELKDQASELVNTSDDLKIKALALVLIGPETFAWSVIRCKAELKEKAFTNPKHILKEADKPNYDVKYLVGLAYLQDIIKDNTGQTAVIWADTQGVILPIAVGENGVDKLTEFLSTNTEAATVTLQTIRQKNDAKQGAKIEVKAAEVVIPAVAEDKSKEIIAEKDKELDAKDAEIEKLKAQLASANVTADAPATDLGKAELEEEEEEEETDEDAAPKTIEQLQADYKAKFDKDAPVNKKNDAKWLLSQLQ